MHLREALTVIRTFAGTRTSIPKYSLNQGSFQTYNGLRQAKSPMLERKQTFKHSDTRTYKSALLQHAYTYVCKLLRKLERQLSYSKVCEIYRKIDLTYTCTDGFTGCSHAWKHVLLREVKRAA
jgi:hypothetical protein